MRKGIDETLHTLLACISDALENAGRPVCEVGTTIGGPVIPPTCEGCGPDREGELWGSTLRVYRATQAGYNDAMPKRPCAPVDWAAEFNIMVSRCFPAIDERGERDIDGMGHSAALFHSDIAAVQRAIHCCTEIEPPYLMNINVQTEPSGGRSYLTAVVRVPVSLKASDNGVE